MIKLAQIVVDQMDREVGRPLDRIHAEQAGDVEGGRRAMRFQLIDLNSASALEVLGIHRATDRDLAGSGDCGNTHGQDGRDRKVIRRARPIDIDGSLARRIETQNSDIRRSATLSSTVRQTHTAHPGANVSSTWRPGQLLLCAGGGIVGRAPVEKAKGRIDNPALARAANQIGERDLVRRDVQVGGCVQPVDPEIIHGIAGVDHFGVAIHRVLAGPGSLGRNSKIHAPTAEAIDRSQR